MSFLLLFILVSACGHVSASFRVPIRHLYSFEDPDKKTLMQHIVVHRRTQEVYVGASNSLYHFDSNLGLKGKVSTGPELDNILCLHPSSHNCTEKLKRTFNDNKVLLIDYNVTHDVLLSCGTLYQGICQVRPLTDISSSSWVGPFDRPAGFVAGRESTVGFFAPGPFFKIFLYAASTYDDRPMQYSPVSVSRRVLLLRDNKFQFDDSHVSYTRFNGVDFDRRDMKRQYKVDYITGFSHGDFSYFLTVQRVFLESVDIETRLVRVCNSDQTFSSYTEVALKCDNGPLDEYNMASAATLEKERRRHFLYVAFLKTVSDHGKWVDRSKGSVVCSYSMSEVVEYFTNATRDCFHAEPGTHLLKHVTGVDKKCSPHEDVQVGRSFCGSRFNNFIEGREAIPGQMRTHLDDYVTSLAITIQRRNTVAVMGTDQGGVVKVLLEQRDDKLLYTINIANETGGQSSSKAIRRQNAFDPSHENIYFLTGHKVVKFPIGSCSVYRDCASCLRNNDPLACGWCGSYCAHLEECETPDMFNPDSCGPVINNVYPLSGPTAGNTQITVLGYNLGSSQTGQLNSGIHVFAAGERCEIVRWENEKIECKTRAVSMPKSGPIVINISDGALFTGAFDINDTAWSSQNFSYAVPKMYGIEPSYGPVSGGTNITIYGEKLNIGAKRNITVNGVPCREFRLFDRTSWCITGRYPDGLNYSNWQNTSGLVEVEIDNAIIEHEVRPNFKGHTLFEFHYRADPQIESIYPQVISLSDKKNLTISGTHLDSVPHPTMVVIVNSSTTGQKMEFEQHCPRSEDGIRMTCPIPPLNLTGLRAPTARAPLVTHVAFIMDDVERLRNLPLHDPKMSQLLYYPDPEYFPFDEKDGVRQVLVEDSILEIQGKNLDLSHGPSDIKVLIDGDKICNVKNVSEDKLYCVLPPMNEESSDNRTRHTVDVVLETLAFHLGYVELVEPEGNAIQYIIVVGVCGFALLIGSLYGRVKVRECQRRRRWRKRNHEYIRSYTAGDQENADSESCSLRRREELNDYTKRPGVAESRPAGTTPKGAAAAVPVAVDDETMHLLQSQNILIHRDYLTLGEVIGQGQFGCVYRGDLRLQSKEETAAVAVKTLHNSVLLEQDAEAFLQEALIMKDFHHRNVLTLIGVCFETDGVPMVVIPYMKHGDLFSYIRSEDNEPTVKDLLTFGVQIAAGMKYLSKIKFVHRDLAARNCVLGDDGTVKVADFGLSRDIYERDYYSSDNKTKLPVKWMAPESLEKGTYSTKTDVWSYGVVLWELMTRGVTPYPDVDNWDIMRYLKSGRRMPQSSHCPDLLYKIMRRCWLDDSKKRPTFAELEKEVEEVIIKLQGKFKKRTVGLDVTYVNYPPPETELTKKT